MNSANLPKPMLVDSHCHLDRLDLTAYDGQLSQALQAANALGVKHFLCVAVDRDNSQTTIQLANQFDDVSASVGIHPTEVDPLPLTVKELVSWAVPKKVVALGETGLDYYRCEGDIEWQRERFRTHIRAAREIGKPLIIHTREAPEDTIRIMREEKAFDVGGVMHCFTETYEMAMRAMDMNFYISFSGIITFRNALALQEVAKKVPLEKMLIETDAPYLAPMPYRGKSNEPAYVYYVAEKLAQLKEVSFDEIAMKTTHNFFNLFKQAKN